MSTSTRRSFLQTIGSIVCLAASPIAGRTQAIEPFNKRINPRIKGLSLTSYSLKRHMKWWWNEQTSGKLDTLDFLDYCAELGLDGVELTSYFFQSPVKRGYVNQIRRRAHVHGLDITGGAMGNNFSHPPDSDVTREQMQYFRTWIDCFADMGANVVRVFASRGRPKNVTDQQVISNVTANLEQALPYAEERGIILGLENHDFVSNIDYLLKIIGDIDSEWLGVIWDSANLAPTPDPYVELARIAPYAVTAQVKVMTKVNGQHTPADYGRLIDILQKANYGGYLVLEYEEPEDPYTAIPRFIKEVQSALSTANNQRKR